MGYESKLYIVEKTDCFMVNEKRYARVIATYDMCKFNAFDDIFQEETDCYIYTDDGNTEIFKDRYNKPLTEASITTIIEYLENYKNSKEYYRRINPLLGLLKGFDCSGWNNLTVLHYGH